MNLMEMHWPYKIVLHDHLIKNYHFVISYQESGVKCGDVAEKWLLLVDNVKLVYTLHIHFSLKIFRNFNGEHNPSFITCIPTHSIQSVKIHESHQIYIRPT
jgi:hypothetical protein